MFRFRQTGTIASEIDRNEAKVLPPNSESLLGWGMRKFWAALSSKWMEWSQGTSKDKGTGERQRAGGNETFVLSPESAHGGGRSSASHKVVANKLWRLRRSDLLDDTAGTEGDAIVRGKFHDLLRAQNLSTSPSPRSSSRQCVSEWVEQAGFVRLFGCFSWVSQRFWA